MKSQKLQFLILLICLLLNVSCSMANTSAAENLFVASTPADDSVKTTFGIPNEKKVDFIRWNLSLNQDKSFTLNINYGEGQPNTNGFKNGGEKLTFNGNFIIKNNVYELKSDNFSKPLSLVKVNENLFHLLTADGKLMTGNGGWSYSLNKKSGEKFTSVWKSPLQNTDGQETIFEGRTPCRSIGEEYKLPIKNDCIKIKWKITFFRDAQTNAPTTYKLQSTLYYPEIVTGNWAIKQNSDAIIYQLNSDKPDESISLLVGDENVLFFLDKKNQLFTGDSDFSFTLNRRK
ncbi:MAG: copper resistance protein NlpE N-terminal domain-containing protein [Pyrinomonadaceae bacterium]|nr:copper resistance protein NlpE N-terminal domain-containing protein [Pyrinomonadaceae bacterium]